MVQFSLTKLFRANSFTARMCRVFTSASIFTFALLLTSSSAQSVKDTVISNEIVYLYTTGVTLQQLGNRQDAVAVLQQAWQKAPGSVQIGLAYARALSELRQPQAAIQIIDSLPQDQVDVLLYRAYVLRSLGRDAEALTAYRQIAAIDSNNTDALSMLTSYYMARSLNDSALMTLKHLGRMNQNNPRPWNEAANIQLAQNDIAGARESFRHSTDADRTEMNFDGVFGMARTTWAAGFPDSALSWAKLVVQYRPQESNGYRMLAVLYGGLDSTSLGIKAASDGLGVKPRDPDLRRQLGLLYYDADSLLESEQVIRGLIKDSSADHLSYRVLSQIKLKQGDTAGALVAADQGTILFPHLSSVWINLADLERRRGHLDLAIDAIHEGLRSSPLIEDSAILRSVEADFHAQNKQYDSAYSDYEYALKIHPDDATLLNNYGYLLADQNIRIEDSYRMIKKAHDLRPEASFIKDSYGWVLFRKGKFDEALTQLLAADSATPSAETSEHIGDVYQAKKDHANALKWWQRSLEQTPNRPSVIEKLKQP